MTSESHVGKRFLFVASFGPSLLGFRLPLIIALQRAGLQVHAAAPDLPAGDAVRTELEERGVIVHDLPLRRTGTNPLADAYGLLAMWRLMRRVRPDYVFGYTIKPVIYGSVAAWMARVPRRFAMIEGLGFVFTSTDGAQSRKRRLLKRLVLGLYKIGASCAERVIFLNPDDESELVAAGVLPKRKSYLLGGIGVDLDKWPLVPPVLQPATFILVARLLREKGVEQYADAARIIKRKHPEARFILLGGLDDNPGSITEDEVRAWVAEGILEWHGHVPVQSWMMQTSVYVLPSYYREGVPASTQEAMAMGRPVITTNVPGCRETVVDGVNGFLIPARDPKALADKMEIFIQQPELITSMGLASRRIAQERFDDKKVNQRLMDLMLAPSPER